MTHGLSAQQKDQIVRRTPAGRLGCSEDVTGIVKFLCSDAAAFITGQTIMVDGGAMA
jgi:3-oxoacyl-[acyl-carrier protein] reductase